MKAVIYGIHPIEMLLHKNHNLLLEVFILKDKAKNQRLTALLATIKQHNIPVHLTSKETMNTKAESHNHQGIVAIIRNMPEYYESDLLDLLEKVTRPPLLLILDGITDPHNLGACLRCADAAGVTAVITPKDRSAALNATSRKVASGAAECVPLIRITNLARTLKTLREQGIWIFGTAGDATQLLYATNLTVPAAIVLGAEDKGLRRLTRENCDELITIPMAGRVSSLNVSVAAGICLFEAVRQRKIK